MKFRSLLFSCAAAGAVLAGVSFALRQGEGEMQMPEVKPGPEHAVLKSMAGEWDAKFMMGATTETGSYSTKVAMNDLWLIQDYKGPFMGAEFTGHGLLGYDQAKKKYVSVWVDTMVTGIEPMEGTYDAAKKELTMSGEAPGPSGKVRMKTVTRLQDRDHISFHMFAPGADGKEAEQFKIEYTRKK